MESAIGFLAGGDKTFHFSFMSVNFNLGNLVFTARSGDMNKALITDRCMCILMQSKQAIFVGVSGCYYCAIRWRLGGILSGGR